MEIACTHLHSYNTTFTTSSHHTPSTYSINTLTQPPPPFNLPYQRVVGTVYYTLRDQFKNYWPRGGAICCGNDPRDVFADWLQRRRFFFVARIHNFFVDDRVNRITKSQQRRFCQWPYFWGYGQPGQWWARTRCVSHRIHRRTTTSWPGLELSTGVMGDAVFSWLEAYCHHPDRFWSHHDDGWEFHVVDDDRRGAT